MLPKSTVSSSLIYCDHLFTQRWVGLYWLLNLHLIVAFTVHSPSLGWPQIAMFKTINELSNTQQLWPTHDIWDFVKGWVYVYTKGKVGHLLPVLVMKTSTLIEVSCVGPDPCWKQVLSKEESSKREAPITLRQTPIMLRINNCLKPPVYPYKL